MERRLYSVLGNAQKLDGGAMFGNAPKAMWEQWLPPDEHNRIDLACRALLVVEPERKVLLETGIGAFFEPKLKERFGIQQSEHVLLTSLEACGVAPADIDVVVLSHLHFDHAGGLLTAWEDGVEPELAFPNARFVVGRTAWERAQKPHARDRASFIPRLQELLEASDRLEIVEHDEAGSATSAATLGPEWKLWVSNGHTPGMLLAEVPGGVVFAGDLIPGVPWVRRAITMGYDRFPELLIDEKQRLLEDLVDRGGRLFFTHDPCCAMAGLARDDRGRIVANEPVERLDGIPA